MRKNFRFLLLSYLPNYLVMPVIGGVLVFLCCTSGVPDSGEGIFARYFLMYPSILLITTLFSGVALTTQTLSMALSYGAKREDYFRAMVLLNLVNTLVFWLSDCLFSLLPHLLGWTCADMLDRVIVSWTFPFMLLLCAYVGCALGELFYRHRVIAGMLGGAMGGLSVMIAPFTNTLDSSPWLWGDLPWLLPVICLCLSGLCLFRVHRKTMAAVVR